MDKAEIPVLKGAATWILLHTCRRSDVTGWAHIAQTSSVQTRASSGSLQQASHGLDKEKDSVVGWHHTRFVEREPWRILPRVGEGPFLGSCLCPTKSAPTPWFPSVSHSSCRLKARAQTHGWRHFLSLGKELALKQSAVVTGVFFLSAICTLETLTNVTQAKQREFIRFWGWHIPLFPAVYWQINSNAFKLHHEV